MSRKIYLVSGHGQGDSGAVGNGYQEANLTRDVTTRVMSYLQGKNVTLYPQARNLYKTKDYSFFERGSYVLEIHFNSASASAKGTELLIRTGLNADSTDNNIYKAMTKFFTGRGIKKRSDLGNMNNLYNRGVGYSLLEVCFITNTADMNIYTKNADQIAKSIADVLGQLAGGGTSSGNSGGNSTGSTGTGSTNTGLPNLSGYQGGSLVDGLKSVNYPSDFNSRKQLAGQLGISSYTGTAAQNTQILNTLKGTAAAGSGLPSLKTYQGNSLVDGLKSVGYDSSYTSRKQLAAKLGISNYTGTAAQNITILNQLKAL